MHVNNISETRSQRERERERERERVVAGEGLQNIFGAYRLLTVGSFIVPSVG